MRIAGIVAEYDPFHNGHFYHLNQARLAAGADYVYVALSGCFKQRGDLSLVSPVRRAYCAVSAGADAVFELPALWTVRDAEHYALGAVSLLSSLGCTHLVFGAECGSLSLLQLLADRLEEESPELRRSLKEYLSGGSGYPLALSCAVSRVYPDLKGILDHPNNTLAVCYLRALKKLRSPVIPVVIPRSGSYHASSVDPVSPAAGAIRSALLRGDYRTALSAVPSETARILRGLFLSGTAPDPAVLDALLLRKLRDPAFGKEALPDCSEGLQDLLSAAAARSGYGLRQLLLYSTTRRYSTARISRFCACALLGISEDMLKHAALPGAAGLLAFRSLPRMTSCWKDLPVPVLSSWQLWRDSGDYQANLEGWRIYAQCCHLPDTLPYSEKLPVIS